MGSRLYLQYGEKQGPSFRGSVDLGWLPDTLGRLEFGGGGVRPGIGLSPKPAQPQPITQTQAFANFNRSLNNAYQLSDVDQALAQLRADIDLALTSIVPDPFTRMQRVDRIIKNTGHQPAARRKVDLQAQYARDQAKPEDAIKRQLDAAAAARGLVVDPETRDYEALPTEMEGDLEEVAVEKQEAGMSDWEKQRDAKIAEDMLLNAARDAVAANEAGAGIPLSAEHARILRAAGDYITDEMERGLPRSASVAPVSDTTRTLEDGTVIDEGTGMPVMPPVQTPPSPSVTQNGNGTQNGSGIVSVGENGEVTITDAQDSTATVPMVVADTGADTMTAADAIPFLAGGRDIYDITDPAFIREQQLLEGETQAGRKRLFESQMAQRALPFLNPRFANMITSYEPQLQAQHLLGTALGDIQGIPYYDWLQSAQVMPQADLRLMLGQAGQQLRAAQQLGKPQAERLGLAEYMTGLGWDQPRQQAFEELGAALSTPEGQERYLMMGMRPRGRFAGAFERLRQRELAARRYTDPIFTQDPFGPGPGTFPSQTQSFGWLNPSVPQPQSQAFGWL